MNLFSVIWREQGTNTYFALSSTMSVKYAIHTKDHTQSMNCFVRVLLTMMPVDRPLANDWKVSVWSGEETYHTLYSLL